MKKHFTQGKRNALLMGVLTLLLCLVLGDGLLGMVSYRDDPTMRALIVLPGMLTFGVGLLLPPWLFRKAVHKRDTFLNIPLYFLAFYLLRSFFEDRVFLTQHYFLQPYISGFIYIPGEKIILPAMAVGLMWGVGWFMLSNLSQAEDPRERPAEPIEEAEKSVQKKRSFLLILLCVAVFLAFLGLGGWFIWNAIVYQNQDAIEQKIQDTYGLDEIVELTFDENGTAVYRGNFEFAFGKWYNCIQLTFLTVSPTGSSQDISVVGYGKEEGEFILHYGIGRFTEEDILLLGEPELAAFLNTVNIIPFVGVDDDTNFELRFTTCNPDIRTVTCRIEGMPKEFFDEYEYVNPLPLLFDPEILSVIIK